MKILILSYLFAPASVIGAIRWTKLSKYLSALGYEVDVLTTSAKVPEDKLLMQDMDGSVRILRVDHKNAKYDQTIYYRDQQTTASIKANNGKRSLKRRIKDRILGSRLLKYPVSLYIVGQDRGRSLDFAKQAEKYIKDNLDISSYGAVICTYGPLSGAMVGTWLKKQYPDVPLIMDFRDPIVRRDVPWPYSGMFKRLQRRICARADRIITVTDDFIRIICGKYSNKCVEIPNGYDLSDFAAVERRPSGSGRYSIVYTGSIYAGLADFSPLFRVINELSESSSLDPDDIEIEYIGSSGAELERQAAEHGLERLINNVGRLPRNETLERQRSARQLLLTIWNNKNDGGYRPGKILEYMVSGNPVIALISGDLAGSVLRRTVESAKIGIAYENAAAGTDYAALRDYIAADYSRWKQGLAPIYAPDEDYINSFSYPELAKRVAAVIEEVTG